MKARPLGLVAASAVEAWTFSGWGRFKNEGGREFRHCRLGHGTSLIIVRGGVGSDRTLSACRWLIRKGAAVLIGTGMAGALHPQLKTGSLVIADKVVEMGAGGTRKSWEAPLSWVEFGCKVISSKSLAAHRGAIVSAHEPVLTSAEKITLARESGALAVDMESSAIARAALEAGVPFFIVRAICDSSRRSVRKEFSDCLDPEGGMRPSILLKSLLHGPYLVPDLIRTTREFILSLAALRRAWKAQMKYDFPSVLASGEWGEPSRKGCSPLLGGKICM